MSTRKTTTATAVKVDNGAKSILIETTNSIDIILDDEDTLEHPKNETEIMETVAENTEIVADSEREMLVVTTSVASDTDTTNILGKAAEPTSKTFRVTRHSSPMLLYSPTSGGMGKKTPSSFEEITESIESDDCVSKKAIPSGMITSTSSTAMHAIRGRKSLKEIKESKESTKNDEVIPKEDLHLDTTLAINKESATDKDGKAAHEIISDNNKDFTDAPASTNRITRKAHAEKLASNTRITRNRRQSLTQNAYMIEQQQKSTGLRGRRKKIKTEISESLSKRKRFDDEGNTCNSTESNSKFIKIEVKETQIEDDKDAAEDIVEQAKVLFDVKQDPSDSDETNASSGTTAASVATTQPLRRGRGRWNPRKRQQQSLSPGTRATRQNKSSSPALVVTTPTASKRRRGSTARSNLSMKLVSRTAGEEDSKDSMTSSVDDISISASEIKQENLLPDFEETEYEILNTDENAKHCNETTDSEVNGCTEAVLTVDVPEVKEESVIKQDGPIDEVNTTIATPSIGSEKAASLSPEMISEGVNVISVKQFYKEPKFLENNLGIEEDPKLGGIVQKVTNTNEIMETEEMEAEVTVMDTYAQDSGNEAENELELRLYLSSSSTSTKEDESQLTDKSSINIALESNKHFSDVCDIDETKEIETNEEKLESDDEVATEPPQKPDVDDEGVVVKDEEDEDITSEFNSMDNNCSLHEYPHEDEEEMKPQVVYDDIDSEILEELAKVGVVDANGNPTSANKNSKSTMHVETHHTVGNRRVEEIRVKEEDIVISDIDDDERSENYLIEQDDSDLLTALKLDEATCVPQTEVTDCNQSILPVDSGVEENKENVDTKLTPKTDVNPNVDDVEGLEINYQVSGKSNTTDVNEQDDKKTDWKEYGIYNVNNDESASAKKTTAEYDEEHRLKKERHLENLGLLTLEAAEQLRQEYLQESNTRAAHMQQEQQQQQLQHTSKRSGSKGNTLQIESTGTLKTVIKLNRCANGASSSNPVSTGTVLSGSSVPPTSSVRKGAGHGVTQSGIRRQSLKMTFQKGRARGQSGADRSVDSQGTHSDDAYYTIQNENEGGTNYTKISQITNTLLIHGRKLYNRFNITNQNLTTISSIFSGIKPDSSHSEGMQELQQQQSGSVLPATISKKDEKEKILIPEKASSFKFHPGRLCEDQCYYCSGRFGLYDTPCHVGQLKSLERQQKILSNEEKLTVDNCLCDACFRHVDRRANAAYKKRLSAPDNLETTSKDKIANNSDVQGESNDIADGNTASTSAATLSQHERKCLVTDCLDPADHSLRRKCIRKSVKKFLLNFEIPTGSPCVWLCQTHYDTIIQCSGCVLCKRRLGKSHMYHITSDTDRLEKSLVEMGIPVQLGIGTAVCKLCRYFANLLMKPPDSTKSQKAEFVKNYRKRLLEFHNIKDESHEIEQMIINSKDTDTTVTADESESVAAAGKNASGKKERSPLHENIHLPVATNASANDNDNSNQSPRKREIYITASTNASDSNSSSSAASLDNDGANNKQMSKLKAILQQNFNNGNEADEASTVNSDKSKSKSTADISNALRANPNISMRELFHGEEDLGLHFKVPFGSSTSQRTPEGWTRVNTFLQYDEPTRQLWEELQKPYGNQSSFLRHLILLEKYYRNGDLVLAPNASSNASVYTQTVRQRINSYDHGHCGGLLSTKSTATRVDMHGTPADEKLKYRGATNIPTVELNDDEDDDVGVTTEDEEQNEVVSFNEILNEENITVDKLSKQLSSNAVTIIARPKDATNKSTQLLTIASLSKMQQKPEQQKDVPLTLAPKLVPASSVISTNSRSILKSNLLGINKSVEIVPLSSNSSISQTNKNPLICAIGGNGGGSNSSINFDFKHQRVVDLNCKAVNNIMDSMQTTTTAATTVATAATTTVQIKPTTTTTPTQQQMKPPTVAQLLNSPPELVRLSRRSSSAVTETGTGLDRYIATKRLQLPKLQTTRNAPQNIVVLPDTLTPQERLQSRSWRPTLLPVNEQQNAHMLTKTGPLYQTADGRRLPGLVQVQSGGKPYLISIFDYNRMCILRREKILRDQMLKDSKTKQPSAGTVASVAASTASPSGGNMGISKGVESSTSSASMQNFNKIAQTAARQQLQQLQQKQQMSIIKPNTQTHISVSGGGATGLRFTRVASKPMPPLGALSSSTANSSNTMLTTAFNPMLANVLNNATGNSATTTNTIDSNTPWLWKNFPESNQFIINGSGISNKMPHLLTKSAGVNSTIAKANTSNSNHATATITSKQQHQQKQHIQQNQQLLENTIMTKIPRSLTVIPQHKLQAPGPATNISGQPAASSNSGM